MIGLAIPAIQEKDSTKRGTARVSGLDGVRALAVLAVMAFHEGMRAAPGGFLGVDVFFVLSGFLITDLLASYREEHGRLGLREFWIRRGRRLLPALAVVLIAVTAAVALIEPGQLTGLRESLLAAITYSSNWYQAFHHVSYFTPFGPPQPLQHLWSLAIEEQFYLVWPLVLGVALVRMRSRRNRALVAWAGAGASALTMALLYRTGGDPSRVYYGTDTHATALLIGAALALTWPLATLASAAQAIRSRLDLLGIGGMAVLAWSVRHFSGADAAVYPAGLVMAALAAAGLTAAAACGGSVSAALSLAPLRWLGRRSYGIYLWHWPAIALAAALAGSARGTQPWRWAAESAAAITLAAASWKWLEEPILQHGFTATCRSALQAIAHPVAVARQSPARAVPAVVAAAAVSVACTAGYGVLHPPAQSNGLQQQVAAGKRISDASQHHQAGAAQPVSSHGASGAAAHSGAAGRSGTTARPAKVHGWQVTAIGDSVMLASAQALTHALPGIYIDAQVSRQMSVGLPVVQHLAATGRLRRVVIVGLGTNGTVTGGQLHQLLRILGPKRKLVVINTFEARPWEHEVNNALAAAARQNGNVVVADWHDAIKNRTGLLWPDEVHPRPPGARIYARVVSAAVQATRFLPGTRWPVAGSILRAHAR
jgi:peptidoglycan/LPS O-acetylase OafA/YrhL